jgi:hypothetical protein
MKFYNFLLSFLEILYSDVTSLTVITVSFLKQICHSRDTGPLKYAVVPAYVLELIIRQMELLAEQLQLIRLFPILHIFNFDMG